MTTKAELRALEKVFAAEITDCLGSSVPAPPSAQVTNER